MKSDEEWDRLGIQIGDVFKPATPVSRADMFAGRKTQIRKVIDTINQSGLHALIFGERGVGKTSLTNMLFPLLVPDSGEVIIIPQINCFHDDTFSTIWRRVFEETKFKLESADFDIVEEAHDLIEKLCGEYPIDVTPDHVRRLLTLIGQDGVFVIVVDEFDGVDDFEARLQMADTLKYLSDRQVPATAILIGVAEDIESLIENHRSVERCLCQIQIPRMTRDESEEIVVNGLSRLEMSIEDHALHEISRLSRGLPHYTHLLALHAGRVAIDRKSMAIKGTDMPDAVTRSLEDVQASIQREYITATTSARADAQFSEVLLSAALADCDELGYFYTKDVEPTFSRISGTVKKSASFIKNLNSFCDQKRGAVLRKDERSHRPRYRFSNSLLQPYVLIRGLAENMLTEDDLRETRADSDQPKLF